MDMKADVHTWAAERFRLTLDLFQAGVEMKRLSLLRRYPDAAEEEIEARLRQWLGTRPGAERGDCPGRRFRLPANPR